MVEAAPRIIANNLTTIGGYAMTIQKIKIENKKSIKKTVIKSEKLAPKKLCCLLQGWDKAVEYLNTLVLKNLTTSFL